MKRWMAIALGPTLGVAALIGVVIVRLRRTGNERSDSRSNGLRKEREQQIIDEPRSYTMDWYQNSYGGKKKKHSRSGPGGRSK